MKFTFLAVASLLVTGAGQQNIQKIDCPVILAEFNRVQTCESLHSEIVDGYMECYKKDTCLSDVNLKNKHEKFISLDCVGMHDQYKQHSLCGPIYDTSYAGYESRMRYPLYCPEKLKRQYQLEQCQYKSNNKE